MPRNGSGTYSLPTGNPVVAGTTIEASWANTTLNDVATEMTGSLARSGSGGMTGPLRLDAGTAGVPALAWSTETTTGLYRAGTNDVRLAVATSDVMRWQAAGVSVTGTLGVSAAATFSTTLAVTGTTTLTGAATLTANPTLSAGTANGVLYLNGSKVATSGSALTFDGSSFIVGQSGDLLQHISVLYGDAGANKAPVLSLFRSGSREVFAAVLNSGQLGFGNTGGLGGIYTDSALNAATQMVLDSSGNLGIGTTTPTAFGAGFIVSQTTGSSGGYSLQSSGSVVTQMAADSTASVGYTGTRSNHPHVFTTNNSEKMRLDSSGNLGIGQSANLTTLDIRQNTTYVLGLNTATRNYSFRIDSGASDALVLGSRTTSTDMLWLTTSGNLGIGTASPTTKLHVSSTATEVIFQDSDTAKGASLTVVLSYHGSDGRAGYIGYPADSSLYINNQNNTPMLFLTNATERMRLDASGNLGLNTATFGTSAAGVLSLGTGTAPTTGPADTVQLFSVDRSAGNTIPAVRCEGSGVTNAGITSTTVTHKIAMQVNGTIYYLLATTNAT